jgi:uncharacterized protein (TIGR00266 family)
MADVIDYKIFGDDMQMVEVELDPGEAVRGEVGAMLYMEQGIVMQTSTGGGLFNGFKRMVTGESFFITSFFNNGAARSRMGFAAPYPGKIIPLDLSLHGGRFLCQKDAFLCAARGIEIQVAFTKRMGAGFFGGEGFILQRLEGDGLAFMHAGGTIIERVMAPGESLRVDTGCLVGFDESIEYNIQFVGGFKNALFGGEGLFLACVTGPGTVYLQTLPLARLADRMQATARGHANEARGSGNIGGDILGNLFR